MPQAGNHWYPKRHTFCPRILGVSSGDAIFLIGGAGIIHCLLLVHSGNPYEEPPGGQPCQAPLMAGMQLTGTRGSYIWEAEAYNLSLQTKIHGSLSHSPHYAR